MQEQEAIKEARAQLKFARISARKVKIVADLEVKMLMKH